ncbi:MAG: hypothetical protein AAGG48_10820 [Planctomycetota bacterium]
MRDNPYRSPEPERETLRNDSPNGEPFKGDSVGCFILSVIIAYVIYAFVMMPF